MPDRTDLTRHVATHSTTTTTATMTATPVDASHDESVAEVAGPDAMVRRLAGQVPIVLFPVRLETRFSDDTLSLRIRIFPDDVHVHTFEPELTTAELEAARTYWVARLGGGAEAAADAWRLLVAVHGVARAEWLVQASTPTGTGADGTPAFPEVPLRESPWTRAPQVAALPARWLAMGFQSAGQAFHVWGEEIPRDLALGPAPDEAADDDPVLLGEPDPVQDDLPIDDGMRWLVDYDEAVRVGMAITVTPDQVAQHTNLKSGLDRLVVVGVDWTLEPEQAAAATRDLLAAHRHTEGLDIVRRGTHTNATSVPTPTPVERAAAVDARDPARPAAAEPTGSGARLAHAFGLSDGGSLHGLGDADRDEALAGHMHTVLWEATWGYFFDQLLDGLVTDDRITALRDHFRGFVRGGGPLPTLRVGDQPYGVLPIVVADDWLPGADDDITGAIASITRDARGLWTHAADRSPHMGRTDDPEADLVDVLQHTPAMRTVKFRTVFGPLLTANAQGLDGVARLQGLTATWLFAMLGAQGLDTRLARATIHPQTRRLTVPLVQDPATTEEQGVDAPLAANYLARILGRLRVKGGFIAFRKEQPTSLLHAMVVHAARLEVGQAATGLLRAIAPVAPTAARVRFGRESELVDVARGTGSDDTPLRLAERVVADISRTGTVADHVATMPDPAADDATRSFAEFRDSLDGLSDAGVADLERAFADTLDCSSHRLDAWLTSLATRRLAEVRDERPLGHHVGGYGWVEDLRPGGDAGSDGFVHTPSLAHAHAAAILRSAHLQHRGDDDAAVAVDLSSGRMRKALTILDGMRQGQSLGALLGYRFERALRERDLRLARYILPARRIAPLRLGEVAADEGDGTAAVEAITARDVVDGVSLLDLWRAQGQGLLSRIGSSRGDRPALMEELQALDDLLDALADLFVAESVFQAVSGNVERSGAAAVALDRQQPAPDPDVLRTPRSGHDHANRVAVVAGEGPPPAPWPATLDVWARAEPRLNTWVAHVLGDPGRFVCRGIALDAEGGIVEEVAVTLADLDLTPMAVLELAAAGGADEPSRLEERVAAALTARLTRDGAVELTLVASSPDPSELGLADLLALVAALRDVVGSARPMDASDLALPEEDTGAGVDAEELLDRARMVIAAARDVADQVASARAPGASPAAVAAAIEAATALGVQAPEPPPTGEPAGDGGDDGTAPVLAAMAAALEDALDRAVAALAPVDDPAVNADPVAGATAAIRAVLGSQFPVLPRFFISQSVPVAESLAARRSLLDGDPLAILEWFEDRALVRPGVARLHEVVTLAEAAGTGIGPDDLVLVQLPHREDARWAALAPGLGGQVSQGRLGVVAHSPGGLDPTGGLAGLVVDDWGERIPVAAETTGLAVHHDAPGSRAPQAILLAVQPTLRASAWDVAQLRDTVLEALDLAHVRAVDPQQVWMAGRVLPSLYVAHNVAGDTSAVDLYRLQAQVGKADAADTISRGG